MAAFLWGEVRKSKVSEGKGERGKGKGERGKGKGERGKGKEAVSFQRSDDLWGWLGRVFILAI